MNTIQEGWESYLETVVHKEAGAVQVRETKQAFYSGCISLLPLLREISGGVHSKDATQGIVAGLNAEAVKFVASTLTKGLEGFFNGIRP